MKKFFTISLLTLLASLPLVSFGQFLGESEQKTMDKQNNIIRNCTNGDCPRKFKEVDGELLYQKCDTNNNIPEVSIIKNGAECGFGLRPTDQTYDCHQIDLGTIYYTYHDYYFTTQGIYINGDKISIKKSVGSIFDIIIRFNISLYIAILFSIYMYIKSETINKRKRIGMSLFLGFGVWFGFFFLFRLIRLITVN